MQSIRLLVGTQRKRRDHSSNRSLTFNPSLVWSDGTTGREVAPAMGKLPRYVSWIVAALLAGTVQCTGGQVEELVANPGRPTVSNPATLTAPGYLQFETGSLGAWHSPEFT